VEEFVMSGRAAPLKEKLKQRESVFEEHTRIRIHRAISWLKRADAETEDADARFIFLWISFNAAYAQELGLEQTERELLRAFLSRHVAADAARRLHALLFEKYSGPVRVLIDNHFVFEPFWRAVREHDASESWKASFSASQKAAMRAVMGMDTLTVLSVVFDRLYVLRNQLVHGGSTWNGRVNRRQVADGASLLYDLVPVLLACMIDNPELDWGPIAYPVI
jgi:hypothetical protein